MWTPGGQIDLIGFHGVYGGGKGGGGAPAADYSSHPLVLTDPVNGKTFTQETNPRLLGLFPQKSGSSAQDQLNAEIADRQAQEHTDSEAAKAKTAQDAIDAQTKFQGSRDTAYNDALAAVQRSFNQAGVDPSKYMESDIIPELQRSKNAIKDLDPNPASGFASNLGQTILGNLTSGARSKATTSLNSIFTPTYANNLLPDSIASPFVDQILNEQFDPLSAQLTNAQKRGSLNDVGYQAALNALNQKKTAARSNITNIGQGIIGQDRTDIEGIASSARDRANTLSLTDTFDPTSFTTQAQGRAQTDLSNFGGALRSAIGDTPFATLPDLLNAGGAVQGATNPSATNPLGIGGVPPADDPLKNQQRGLGNQGAF